MEVPRGGWRRRRRRAGDGRRRSRRFGQGQFRVAEWGSGFQSIAAPGPPEGSSLEVGDKCEARYGGKAKYYGGTIARKNRDGSYDIKYDGGPRRGRTAPASAPTLTRPSLLRSIVP